MTTFGISDTGFTLKRLYDILNDMQFALAGVIDPVSGENLTPNLADENDPLVQLVNAVADLYSIAWEQLQVVTNQFDPLKAIGAPLSGLVQLNNLRRQTGSYATANFAIVGTPNKSFQAGIKVSDINANYIFVLPAFVLDDSGNAVVIGTCTVKGVVVVLAGQLVKIMTPISGLTSAISSSDSIGGSDDESDTVLRARQQHSTAGTAKTVIDAFYSKLGGIQGVTQAKVYQNRFSVIDDRGLPPKSVAVVIKGGQDSDISAAIFEALLLGGETYGTTTTVQTDTQGISYPILFTRPETVNIYIDIEYAIVVPALWSSDGETNIKSAIIAWAEEGAAGVGITSGYDRSGYLLGETVYASELYVPINSQLGIKIVSVHVGTDPYPVEDEVFIDWNEIATFSSANISLTQTSDSSV